MIAVSGSCRRQVRRQRRCTRCAAECGTATEQTFVKPCTGLVNTCRVGVAMDHLPENASRRRQREAQRARDNRAEIVKALSHGQITRRDLYRWGLFTATGTLALKNGLSPFAPSAFADSSVPTGTPRSPLFGAQKFTQVMPRLALQTPIPLIRTPVDGNPNNDVAAFSDVAERTPGQAPFLPHRLHRNHACRPAVHQSADRQRPDRRPPAGRGVRAPALERVLSQGRLRVVMGGGSRRDTRFHPEFPGPGRPNSVWTYGTGTFVQANAAAAAHQGPLRRAHPARASTTTRRSTARRTTASAATRPSCTSTTRITARRATAPPNVHHFPGTFYDYRWSTTLARRDKINTGATDIRALRARRQWRPGQCRGRLPRAPGHACGRTTTASSSPPRMSTRAISA